jgi:thiamine-phosphate pyrophosphorylase
MDVLADRIARARLYFVSDRVDVLEAALRGGVDVFQLRDKSGDDDAVLAAAAVARRMCAAAGALFLVNDRPDLAVAAGADGVHVGQDDLPVAQARAAVGPDALVGLSTHSPAQVDAASEAGVDYIGVGPVYATPTKAGREPVGVDLVAYAARHARIPFFAIGGIDTGNAASVIAAGAQRLAVVRAIAEAGDPEAEARRLRAATEKRTQVGIT